MSQIVEGWDLSYTQNRELSWLKFNERVLQEAADPTVPLMERLRFVSIFTSNLDEFFMVRVGSLFDLNAVFPKKIDNKSGKTAIQQLDAIYEAVRPLISLRDEIYADLMEQLKEEGIVDVPYRQLRGEEKDYVQDYYKNRVYPLLVPQIIDRSHPFPHLKNKRLYAVALLKHHDRRMLGIVGVPEEVPPILVLPGQAMRFVRMEDVLQGNLKKIFKIYPVAEKCVITVTRNADISYDDGDEFEDDRLDFRSQMMKLLRKRENLAPVRLEMQGNAPTLQKLLQEKLKLTAQQTYICQCPMVLKYVYRFDQCDASLYYPPHQAEYSADLQPNAPVWPQVQKRDVLLFYPYHTMKPFLNLLKEAGRDPAVRSIQITIYRVANKSAVIKYLCEAAENGKNVTVLVELRARFDERNNIEWAKELEEAGCTVVYGIDHFKCHSKICLITRQEEDGSFSHVTHIGTGNFNEKTANLYTDFSLLTADPAIAKDALTFFKNMLIGDLYGSYDKLLVAPCNVKSELMHMIEQEIEKGEEGHIILKINSLTERDLIDKLAKASQAGVKIELIVRGICCLLPGISKKTKNIRIINIVGRFLEHSRVYCFGDGDERKIYISSADLMTRNQTRRVEIACPVQSPEIKAWLSHYLQILLSDNVKARCLMPSGNYEKIKADGKEPLSSQEYFETNLHGMYQE